MKFFIKNESAQIVALYSVFMAAIMVLAVVVVFNFIPAITSGFQPIQILPVTPGSAAALIIGK